MGKINIIGLGPGDTNLISYRAYKELYSDKKIILRTDRHPICDEMKDIEFESLDRYYESEESFEDVYNNIANYVIECASKSDVVYAVPGHPRVAESTVDIIEKKAEEKNIEVEVIASMSFIDAMYNLLKVDPSHGFTLLDAFSLNEETKVETRNSLIITQVYDWFIATDVKLFLMEHYSDYQEIYIVRGAGVRDIESKKKIKLLELDRNENFFDHLTSVFVPGNNDE